MWNHLKNIVSLPKFKYKQLTELFFTMIGFFDDYVFWGQLSTGESNPCGRITRVSPGGV